MTSTTALKHLTNPNFGRAPENQNPLLQRLGEPHTTSFNYMVDVGLSEAVADLFPVEFELPNKDKVIIKIDEANLGYPVVPSGVVGMRNQNVYPIECRQRASTYKGRFSVRISWWVNGIQQVSFDKDMGDIPIMLKSNRCHLNKMNPEELVKNGEHEQEWGGYFVVKGMERLVRMLLITRKNYPISIKRSGWKGRGALFSEYGIMIRCVRNDHTSVNNVLHFVTDGTAKLMFSHRKALYFAPLILIMKALGEHVDYYIHRILTEGCENDQYYIDSVENMLRNLHEEGLHTSEDCREFLGKMFRGKFFELPEWFSNRQVADFILKKCILVHLDDPEDKFFLLAFMTKKLFAFAQNKCATEGADAVMMQELLLGGHLYLKVLKEKLQIWLLTLKSDLLKRARLKPTFSLNITEVQTSAKYAGKFDNAFEMFLATGNLHRNSSGLGLMQDKGLTIVPENINRMRYMSHFKAVHRGTFFQTMRTTEARQLLPDAWGFICPVHTPDGAPCGLLNHLTMDCTVTDSPNEKLVKDLPRILKELGMLTLSDVWLFAPNIHECYTTMVDGKIVGHVPESVAKDLVDRLRLLKVEGEKVPRTMEIVLVPKKKNGGQFPGLFLFTGAARMMRPVVNLMTNTIELIGTFEQVYLHVCVKPEEAYDGVTTHMELSSMAIMSNLAQLIPMPDCNQSPRNMYQCQMGKQTMGTACHNYDLQADTKLYRLQTPTAPLFKTKHYDDIDLDDFAMGTNAIVAVISYTGYDMEDAIVINKCSAERGFAYGSIYKSEFIQLEDSLSYFCRDPTKPELAELLDTDGLPFVGRPIKYDEPLYCYYNYDESRYSVSKFKGKEACFVNSVRLCGDFAINSPKVACITYRVQRAPSVGDKFASRAGQKGICSQQWLAEDLPFTETGVVPDILFNPHGFPSRMTIAMMIEIMAGKSAAIHGVSHDATPFKFDEDDTAIDYFGRCLTMGGYNYYGTETMYSGIDGRMMEAQIFTGVVHYQRLRHMVADKWQVRSTGPMDAVTRQPVKGRKRGGGVRFGEMERDSLISHGASFLLQDRLLNCSDKCTMFICTKCKSLLGPVTVVTRMADKAYLTETKEHCRLCGNGDNVGEISIPYIFKFFVTQLASVNIHTRLECTFA